MSKRKAIDYLAKCEGPVEEFITFAKGLTGQRGQTSLTALTASPAVEQFAKRLLEESLGGQAHAATCMPIVAHLAKDRFWADKFRSNVTGHPPAPDQLRPKDVEPVGCVLLILFPEAAALGWIALGNLTMKGASPLRAAVQDLLVKAAPTANALFEALACALEAIEFNGQKVSGSIVSRAIEAIVAHVGLRHSKHSRPTEGSRLARLAIAAKRTEITRLVAALLSIQSSSNEAIAEAAWTQADDALARALQNSAALTHALDQAGEVDSTVRGYAEIVVQAVDGAAAKRELELEGAIGGIANFDSSAHTCDDPTLGSKSTVRITMPAVAQGKKTWRKIIRKAEIVPE